MRATRRIRILTLVAAAAFLGAGCEDLTGRTGSGEHQVVVSGGGSTLATASTLGIVSGSVSVGVNAQRTITVTVLDRAGAPVLIGPGDQIRVFVTNEVVARFDATALGSGSVTGTLRGLSFGTTSLRVQLLRGGTAEYDSPSIPVVVG